MIALIWAEDQNGLIGADGQLPWHLPADMHHFKTLTTGHDVVMGRKTFAGFKRPLPNRTNWVLSRQTLALPAGVHQLASLEELQALDAQHPQALLFVIGGANVFETVLPIAQRLYRTQIAHAFTGDTWMPAVDYQQWRLDEHVVGAVDEKNRYPFSFDNFSRR
ncbi:dihydrofolate reductase [Lactiplantibacillus xiangfangensis]|uniref:Dihydrofolate reductase n=1 Tax=Lactiplantibacillus xiangfangensis TaxID=942150 RepID=A0A0R2M440_9LACO|nr:dihydrofolate reductase [Lactiplantibacillus xiangfangensis]KRO08609.1 dihydrofolate reductase [Lactiplantibacillus xiangfangensis]